jgi:hypothetical protein
MIRAMPAARSGFFIVARRAAPWHPANCFDYARKPGWQGSLAQTPGKRRAQRRRNLSYRKAGQQFPQSIDTASKNGLLFESIPA